MSKKPANNPSKEAVKNIVDQSQSLTTTQKRAQVRKNAQQTLLYLHDVIAINNQRYYTSDDSDKVPAIPVGSYAGSPGHGVLVADPPKWKSGYKNIIPIEKGSLKDGVSPITSLGKDVEKFFTFKLTSAQQAALYPKIRLYKIEYELDGNGNIVLPFIEKARKEIIFEKAITTKELQILTDKGGNIGSSGIESFDWKLMGVNPAEVDSNIEASLKIYFNNIGVFAERIENLRAAADLTAAFGATTSPLVSSVVQSRIPELKQAHFLDLITFAPPTSKGLDSLPCSEVYDPSFFEILAEVGWEVVDTELALFAPDQKEYINRQTVSLYLTLTDHKFDFKEDGSATLVANYRARQTFSGPRDDILYPLAELKSEIDDLEKLQAVDKPDSGKIKKAEKEISGLLKANYKRIISGLLDNVYEAEVPNAIILNGVAPVSQGLDAPLSSARGGGITSATLTYSDIFTLLQINSQNSSDVVDINLAAAIDRIRNAYADALSGKIKVNRKDHSRSAAPIYATLEDPDTDLSEQKNFDEQHGSRAASRGKDLTSDFDDTSTIQFFYLGDILEVMFETIKMSADLRDKKVSFVLTDFQYLNLLKVIHISTSTQSSRTRFGAQRATTRHKEYRLQSFDFATFKCKQKTLDPAALKTFYSVLNVANIPIEATAFLDFFAEKIIAQDRQSYYLNNFLNDIFINLVKPALGDNAILGIPNNQPALINIDISAVDTINSPLFKNKNELGINDPRANIGSEEREYKLGTDDSKEYIWISTIKNYIDDSTNKITKAVFWQNPAKNAKNNVATVKVLGVNGGVNFLDGKYNTNIENNISNFVVGLDRGIIKSVSFERVDQPHLREARTATDKSFGVGQLRELYNVNLTLYGNNILKPGNMIYVEPNRFIFGRPTEIASVSRLLGLGGYHLVVDVSNTIGKEGWETTVKALHMAMPAIPE